MNKNETIKKILSQIDNIKRINDNPKSVVTDVFDLVKDRLPSEDGTIRRSPNDFLNKRKSKKNDKRDIFGEITQIADAFIGTSEKNGKTDSKIKKYATDSAKSTLEYSKQIIADAIKNIFFSGNGVCGSNMIIIEDSIELSPLEFDFLSLLSVDPSSTTGKIMYETDQNGGFVKMNREFYKNFDSGVPYSFVAIDGKTLFTILWDESTQKYTVSGLKGAFGSTKVQDFISDYYSSIEYPDIEYVIKQAMLMAIQGDGTEPLTLTIGMNMLERLLQKLFALCDKSQSNSPLNQNPVDESEDEDVSKYFNFEEVEGIDLDEEDARIRGVMKFKNCDNFEVPINSSIAEDAAYFASQPGANVDEVVTNALGQAAADAAEKSNLSFSIHDLEISITGLYITKIPKALICSILSPKIFFPIVTIYKLVKGVTLDVKELMKRLSKLFFQIIKKLFLHFIKEFWNFIKKDLLTFVKSIAAKILLNKIKRWKAIITGLIALLTKVLDTDLGSCESIFEAILSTINKLLSAKINIPVPGLLLVVSQFLPGYSTDRATMNANLKMAAAGIPMAPLYGRENKLNTLTSSIISGISEEEDTSGYIEIALSPTTIPVTPGGAIINPMVKGYGKKR